MLLGYNRLRPKEENYTDFMEKLVTGLESSGIDGLSLMIFGSYLRGEMDFGRSDIDAAMIFDNDVVIDKADLALCSRVLAESLDGNHIPFQVTVSDRRTMQEGTFNSYIPSFEEYLKEEGRILVGPDYRDEFTFKMPHHPEQTPLTFNLRKCRQGLLLAEYDKRFDYEQFLRRFGKSLDAVSRGSKQILFMQDGRFMKNRFSALERIREEFPKIDIEPLARIKDLYNHPEKLNVMYHKPEEVLTLWKSAVTFFEQIVKNYLDRNTC